jgi:hypothetical protein
MVKAFKNMKSLVPNWFETYVEPGIIDVIQCVELDDSFLVLLLDKLEPTVEFQIQYVGKYPIEYDCLPDECVWAMTHNEFLDDMSIDTTEYETLEQYANQMFINQLAGYGM